jgi:hypothetical protein
MAFKAPHFNINPKCFYNITDFRDTPLYKHICAMPTMQEKSDEQKVVMAYVLTESPCDNMYDTSKTITMRDSHTFSAVQTEKDSRITIPVKAGGDTTHLYYSGIYDIILKDCSDVTRLSLVFEYEGGATYEICISTSSLIPLTDGTFRLPLAFHTKTPHEQHLLYMDDNDLRFKTSFIPTGAVAYNMRSMYIKMNAGAQATASISTVYLKASSVRVLIHGIVKFYIDGEAVLAYNGKIKPYSDDIYKNFFYRSLRDDCLKAFKSALSYLTYPLQLCQKKKD